LVEGPGLVDQDSGHAIGVFEPEPGRILILIEDEDLINIMTVEDFGLRKPYPPLESDNLWFAGIVVLAALGGSLGAILLLLWAIGG
jgi:hypothetical protein